MDRLLKTLDRSSPLLVLLGLIFVGLELKQSTDAVKAQTRSQISVAYAEYIRTFAEDEEILETYGKALSGAPLQGIESVRFELMMTSLLRLAENTFYQHREGNYSDSEFQGEREFWKRTLSAPELRESWERWKRDFSPEFRREIDALLE